MNWTAEKKRPRIVNGEYEVTVQYREDSGATFTRLYASPVFREDWPDFEIRARLDQLNALDLNLIETGPPKPKPEPAAPTQEQIDRTAFVGLLKDLRAKEAALGRSKTVTKQDVEAADAAVTAAFKDEYAPLLKVF